MQEVNIIVEGTFKKGHLRPLGRGLVVGEYYIEDFVGKALIEAEVYSPSGGSTLEEIHVLITIKRAEKG